VLNQAGYGYAGLGEWDKAFTYIERYAAINPGQANPLDSLAELNFRRGRFDVAKAKYQEALEVRPDFFQSCYALAYVFALEENYGETQRWMSESVSRSPGPLEKGGAAWMTAYYGYFLGRWGESLAAYKSMRPLFEMSGAVYARQATDWVLGFIHADRGEFDQARRSMQAFADSTLEPNPWSGVTVKGYLNFLSGWVDLKQGRLDSAKRNLGEIESVVARATPAEEPALSRLVRLLEAELALAGDLPDEAAEAARKFVPEDFPGMNINQASGYNLPFLKDALARAYWKKGDLDKAIGEYRRLMTIDPDTQVRYLIHPLYHYRLGRVYEDKGEKAPAAAEYRKFLECWKDADATHPELADARKRLQALEPAK
jgi:tetratricopeptide (TPR) repeat protein